METKDLRRGNLILTSKDKGGQPFLRSIVKEIKVNSVIVEGDREVRIEDCAGIPIDEQWLAKFGFLQTTVGWYINSPKINSSLYLRYESGNWWIVYFKSFLQYVHQLQNLFHALTGEELTIKST